MKTLKSRYYKKYAPGGDMQKEQSGNGPATALAMAPAFLDAFDSGNSYGRQSVGITTAKGALSGAAMGTQIAPGIGTAIGAAVGGGVGYLTARKAKKAEDSMKFNQELQDRINQNNRSAAILGTNPALMTGRPGADFYATGGFLKNRYYDAIKAEGGNLKPLSSDSAEVQGPSHEQGGVELPQYQSEVEGNETIQDGYVFSDRLGFAKIHKKLASAIGKIEQKPATPDRINALKRLNQSVEQLKATQEQIRKQYNLQ